MTITDLKARHANSYVPTMPTELDFIYENNSTEYDRLKAEADTHYYDMWKVIDRVDVLYESLMNI